MGYTVDGFIVVPCLSRQSPGFIDTSPGMAPVGLKSICLVPTVVLLMLKETVRVEVFEGIQAKAVRDGRAAAA